MLQPTIAVPRSLVAMGRASDPATVIDRLEFAAINGYKLLRKRVEVPAQQHELPAEVAYANAIVLAEVGDRLEAWC